MNWDDRFAGEEYPSAPHLRTFEATRALAASGFRGAVDEVAIGCCSGLIVGRQALQETMPESVRGC